MKRINRLLIANRGEIAIRIARAASELGITAVAVYPGDDQSSAHVRSADEAMLLSGTGASAYLDIDDLITQALQSKVDAVHPGYGFLSENADFARAVESAGMIFVGPTADALTRFGDKVAARELAKELGVPTINGSQSAVSQSAAEAFFAQLPQGASMVIKALSGGGGRGMRVVDTASEVGAAYERASSEANAAFGDSAVYVEQYLPRARHVEVQVVGDGVRIGQPSG